MLIEHVEVYGFQAALRGSRNAMNSWDKSDTVYNALMSEVLSPSGIVIKTPEAPCIGSSDQQLLRKLITAPVTSERKFMRMIQVWLDLSIPLDVWTELDTYKVATTRNSCSTMHKGGSRDLVIEDFQDGFVDLRVLDELNRLGHLTRTTKGQERVANLIKYKRTLPCGYLQKSTYNLNYETAFNIIFSREDHRLPEWNKLQGSICEVLLALPYMSEFVNILKNHKKQDWMKKALAAKWTPPSP